MQTSRSNFLYLSLIVLFSVILRLIYIGKTDLGGDECFSLFISQYNVSEIISILKTGDNPPLWEIFLHYWCIIFGTSEVSIRIPSLIFNVLTLLPIFYIAKTIGSIRAGLFACLFFTFSSFSLFISHEARVYSFVGLLSSLSVLYFVKFLKSNENNKNVIVLTLCNVLLFYSHYLSMWIVVMEFFTFLFFFKEFKTKIKSYFIHLVVWFVMISLFIPVLFNRFMDSGVNGTWVPEVKSGESIYFLLWSFLNKPIVVILFLLLLLFGIIQWILKKNKSLNKNVLIIHLWFWIPLLISFVLSFKVSFFLDRYLYFLVPFLFLSISFIIDSIKIKPNWIQPSLFIIFSFIMILTFRNDSSKMGYSGHHFQTSKIVDEIKNQLKNKNTSVITCPNWYEKEIMYYFNKKSFFSKHEIIDINSVFKKVLNNARIYPVLNSDEIKSVIIYNRVVYFDNDCDFHFQNNNIKQFLESNYSLNKEYEIEGKSVMVYERL